ncbi:hypothetical protein E3P77_00756 [Wallemia ichthyophaga]|nr:hypothetical protein E3P77_00756 [Wallemia ichthyophaga]
MLSNYFKILNSLKRIYTPLPRNTQQFESLEDLYAYARDSGGGGGGGGSGSDTQNAHMDRNHSSNPSQSLSETHSPKQPDSQPSTTMSQTTLQPHGIHETSGISHTPTQPLAVPPSQPPSHSPRYTKVPSSRLGRLFHYGGLAAGLTYGTASQVLRGGNTQHSALLSPANVDRLVAKLSVMRGAALKLGQFLSIQDSHLLPPEIETALTRLQNKADYMPNWQLERVLAAEYGADWISHFEHFDKVPVAAASIGQVHTATLSAHHPTHPRMHVALKIQFPGVKESISSDLNNLKLLVAASGILPRGLFLDNTIRQMRTELADECDYLREAECGERFGEYLHNDAVFSCPVVVKDLCTPNILTTQFMPGESLSRAYTYDQPTKDKIGSAIMRLCISEIFQFRLMQTDPNWSNFLWDGECGRINLIDFGASRAYTEDFVGAFGRLLLAAGNGDREECVRTSLQLGYLTGDESEEMINAHIASMLALGEPFRQAEPYSFLNQTITERVKAQIPIMLQHRLTPPPKETYSLNRKLSGAFLLCSRLGSVVNCREIWEEVTLGRFESNSQQSEDDEVDELASEDGHDNMEDYSQDDVDMVDDDDDIHNDDDEDDDNDDNDDDDTPSQTSKPKARRGRPPGSTNKKSNSSAAARPRGARSSARTSARATQQKPREKSREEEIDEISSGEGEGEGEDDLDQDELDDLDDADTRKDNDKDEQRLTARQRAALKQPNDDGTSDTPELMSLDIGRQHKTTLTEEEQALKKAELLRRRKHQSDQRLENEKVETINRLLTKTASKRRGKKEEDKDEEDRESSQVVVDETPQSLLTYRWVSRPSGALFSVQ